MKSVAVSVVLIVAAVCLSSLVEAWLNLEEFSQCDKESVDRAKTLYNSVQYSKKILEEILQEQVDQDEETQREHDNMVEYLKDMIAYKTGHIEYIKKHCPFDSSVENPLNRDPIPLFGRISELDATYKKEFKEAQTGANPERLAKAQADLDSWQERKQHLERTREQWRERAQSGDLSFKPEIN